MAIFRGVGGSGSSSDNSFLQEVTAQAQAAEASATSAANSLATIQNTEVTSASFNTGDGVLTLTKLGGATVTADLDGRFLTSYTETNDLSSAVTWTNVPNAYITAGSVTQHQAALTITESQISDLQSYLTSYTETNNLATAVTWADVPDANITESSVTQHQAALSITESQISDLGTYLTASDITGKANLSGATFTGDINLGDSNKINLGASNDLQIYHDGSNSYIDEQGTGDLILKGLSHIKFQRADTGTDMFLIRPNRVETYDASGNRITKVDADGLSVTGDLDVTGTVDGKDVSTLERVHRCRFSKGSPTLYLHVLSTTLAQLGDTYSTKATTGSENNFNLSLDLTHSDTLDTNDAYYHVSVDAGSNETVITLGTLASVTTAGAYKQGYVSGDVTKHFSDFMGIARQSGGGSPVNLNGFGWYYNASENRTYMYCYLYQVNNFVTGDTLYLHPFDWESAGTTIQSRTYEIDAATYDGAVKSTYNKEHYLGYFKSSVDITVKGGEPSSNTDGNNVIINKISGSIVQVED